jgi:hypothetical protein
MREPISIDERRQEQEAKAQGKEWKPEPQAPAPKEVKEKELKHEGKTPEEQPDKAASGNMPWNRRS